MSRRNLLVIVLGLLLAAAVGGAALQSGLSSKAAWTAALAALCAIYWVTEPIPIAATSLIPFATLPLVGVLDHREVARSYGHTLILLLLGGFILSTAMERSGAHRRLALKMVWLVGGRGGRRLVLGFMLATGLSSMWISNTATTLMMLPIAAAVLEHDKDADVAVPLLLGIAYAASIGGIGTPIGTPPNVIFMGVYRELTGNSWSFLEWMKIGVPVVCVLLPLAWWSLTFRLKSRARFELPELGPWRKPEKRVLFVFGLTALAWMTRSEPWGGWSHALGAEAAGDSTVALFAVVAMFFIPNGEGERLLDWKTASSIPWGLLILFGGGIALARAFESSGLSQALGQTLSSIANLPLVVTIGIVCLGVTFLTELTSNTATATLLMPILAATALGARREPALLMVPAAMSASCAFMLPVATAPNAIIFSTERVTIRTMAVRGFYINLIGAAVITALITLLL